MNAFTPVSEDVLASGLLVFGKVSTLVSAFVAVVFFMRIAFLVVKISSAQEYGKLILDVVVYFGVLSLFPILVKLIVTSIGGLAQNISYLPPDQAQSDLINFADMLFSSSPILLISIKTSFHFVQTIAYSIYTVMISLFIAAAPIFIFLATILELPIGLKAFFAMLISFCLWPVMWNILGQLALAVGSQIPDSPISSVCFWIVILALQLLSPLFVMSLFKNMSADLGTSKALKIASFGKKVF